VKTLTSEKTGFVVREKTVADAWYQILNTVMKFGPIKKSQHSSDQRELVNLMAIVEEEDPDNPKIEPWLWFGKSEIENYYPQVMTANVPAGTEYTYGNRLRHHAVGGNQIDFIIKDLKEAKHSRRAVAVTWQHDRDMGSKNPPCWVVLHALVQEEKLYLTCYLRSNDMFSAWPLNAFGLRKIQKEIAGALDVDMGPLTTISSSAHIYEHDWNKASEILEKYKLPHRWNFDPRGNFVIKLDREKKEIIVDYYTTEMKKVDTFVFQLNKNGKTNIDIYSKLTSLGLVSQVAHGFDLGAELVKAELALRYGLKYSQDDPLDVNEKA
jgi:thymidylate synthase